MVDRAVRTRLDRFHRGSKSARAVALSAGLSPSTASAWSRLFSGMC